MEQKSEKLIIESVRADGQRFRPSDWIERISANLASFGPARRLQYAQCVQPTIINGQKCLVVDPILKDKDPEAYRYIMGFAESNHLRIQPDRRQHEEPVHHEQRHA